MNPTIRSHISRIAVTAAAAVLGSGVVLGIVQANVQEWAKASGNDQYLVKYSGPTMDRLAEITSSGPFVFVTAMLIGGALFLWADTFVRRWLEWRANNVGKISFRIVDRKLASMTALFVLIVATAACGAWVLYERRSGTSQPIDSARSVNPKPKLTLSEEDRRFRYELRGFSLSTLNDVLQSSARTFGMLRAIDRQRNEGTAELGARDYFIHFATSTMDFGFQKIKDSLSSTNADDIDSDQVQDLILRYFQEYSQFQKFIAQLNAVLDVDLPKTEEMLGWLDADKRCRNELQKLKAWPQASKIREIQDGMFASVERTWERPPIPVSKKTADTSIVQKENETLRMERDGAVREKARLESRNRELQATLETERSKRVSSAPEGAQSAEEISKEDTGPRRTVWQGVEGQMSALNASLDQGYQLLDSWPSEIKLDRSRVQKRATDLSNSISVVKNRLHSFYGSYQNYSDVIGALKELAPVRSPLPVTIFDKVLYSIQQLSTEVLRLSDPLPQDFEDSVKVEVAALRRDLDNMRKWQTETRKTAIAKANELKDR